MRPEISRTLWPFEHEFSCTKIWQTLTIFCPQEAEKTTNISQYLQVLIPSKDPIYGDWCRFIFSSYWKKLLLVLGKNEKVTNTFSSKSAAKVLLHSSKKMMCRPVSAARAAEALPKRCRHGKEVHTFLHSHFGTKHWVAAKTLPRSSLKLIPIQPSVPH